MFGAIVAVSVSPAWGLINKEFTPIHLTGEAQLILKVRADAKPADGKVQLKVVEALKGKAAGAITLELDSAVKEHVTAVNEIVTASMGKDMLLFAGKYPDKDNRMEDKGYLHVQGRWLTLTARKAGGWSVVLVDTWMDGTWNGGTDMLERCTRYILEHGGEATVPVESGTAWRAVSKVGKVAGKVRGVEAVDLAGDGKCVLHFASSEGDVLLRAKGNDDAEFENLTAARKLATKTLVGTWGDFNGDGRVDLASWDGKALTIHSQQADGTFVGAAAKGAFTIPAAGAALAAVGLGDRSALVVAGGAATLVLQPAGGNAFEAVRLDNGKVELAKLGKVQRALVADFNNDSLPDILIPGETGGVLYAGKAGGAFAAGVACAVHCTKGGGVADVGDFDADGRLDVLAGGTEGVRVWQNLPDGTFAERMQLSGEISYKAQPFASWCGVCDLNNDSRQDIFITYSDQQPLLYFNRGFRSFGEAPMLENGLREGPENVDAGQQAGAFADVDGDGAQDFVIVLSGGDVWCAYNDLGGECLGVRVRLKGLAGPVSATLWRGKRCLGTVAARAGRGGFLGIEEAGEFTVKYALPGGQGQVRKIVVEEGVADVVIGKDK